MDSEAERALIADLQRGDTAAFDAIYERHRARIFSFLARLTGRRDLAEDLVQETFMRLVRNAARLRADTRLDMWLLTVARNLCRSHYRWAFVDRTCLATLARSETETEAPSPFDMTSARELERELERALGRLGFEQREVLILSAIERLPAEDIARMLGLTPEAVRQRLSRARKQLAQRLTAASPPTLSRLVSDES